MSRSDYDGQNRQSAGRDEIVPPTQRRRLNRSNVRFPSGLSPGSNRRTVRPVRRARSHNQSRHNPRGNFSKEQFQYLESWYNSHKNNPYPEPHEANDLATQASLTPNQVKEWFKRKRSKSKLISYEQSHHSLDASDTQMNLGFDQPIDGGEPFDSITEFIQNPSTSQEEPSFSSRSSSTLKAYLQTADEGFPPITADSVQRDDNRPYFRTRSGHTVSSQRTGSPTLNEAGTTYERPPPNQLSSQQSSFSIQSNDTAGRSRRRKKGRRLIKKPPVAPDRQGDKKFQCTWCNRGYKYRSDWVRHLETHAPQHNWICMHNGPRLVNKGNVTCAFCGEPDPEDEHFNTEHNALPCFRKPEQDRTFPRSDGLFRHMKDFHMASIQTPPDSWRVPEHENDTQQLWCGFCDENRGWLRTTWESWLDHIGNHFIGDNLDMTHWWPEPNLLDDMWTPNTTTNPSFSDTVLPFR